MIVFFFNDLKKLHNWACLGHQIFIVSFLFTSSGRPFVDHVYVTDKVLHIIAILVCYILTILNRRQHLAHSVVLKQ